MEIIVAIIVGLLSGALGSVLGPLVAYRLGRQQRQEQRTEQRHAELRAMLRQREANVRRHRGAVVGTYERVRDRIETPADALVRYLTEEREAQRQKMDAGYVWEPHRIDDEELRLLAIRLARVDGQLKQHLRSSLEEVTPDTIENWYAESAPLTDELDSLRAKIDLRLDELGW